MPDKTLACKDCNAEFVFSEGEQSFYKEKGFLNEPQRCLSCRTQKKQQRRTPNPYAKNRGFGNSFANKLGSYGFSNGR